MKHVKIALLQSRAFETKEDSWREHEALIEKAASAGARIICTQELFDTSYFCKTQNVEQFDLAEPVSGELTERFCAVAKRTETVLIVSFFERRTAGVYHNSAAIIDADGQLLGIYRKMHIPQDPGFEEKFYFTPGDTGFKAWDTHWGKIGVIICWDQWFPESARLTALQGAEIIFCPTAIGWIPGEEELYEKQRNSWLNVQKGHAVANGCYYAAVNRIGEEGNIRFWGNSFVADFYGEKIAEASIEKEEILYADCDLQALEDHRRIWPFFRDRRVDAYSGLSQIFGK